MKSANDTYQDNRKKIDAKIEQLKQALQKMDYEQQYGKNDWGFAGSAAEVLSQLNDLLEFVG